MASKRPYRMKTDFGVGDRVYIDDDDEYLTELAPSLQSRRQAKLGKGAASQKAKSEKARKFWMNKHIKSEVLSERAPSSEMD